jgi:hypothetical protein
MTIPQCQIDAMDETMTAKRLPTAMDEYHANELSRRHALAKTFEEKRMCIDPNTEIKTNKVDALLEAIDDARNYVAIHTPHARTRLRLAGGPELPAIDYNAQVLVVLRRAMAEIAPVSTVYLPLE